MPRFLIEVRHEDERDACIRALHALEQYGSHFVTTADFGCHDGVHAGWLIADLENPTQAAQLVPPEMRCDARVIRLNRFTREQITSMIRELDS